MESTLRVTGVGLALVGGGLLLDVFSGLPFLVAGGLVVLILAPFVRGLRSRWGQPVQAGSSDERSIREILDLLRDHQIRMLTIANGFWNFALAALRAFVVLFFVAGLERSSTFVATVIFPAVALGIVIAAPASGWIADRYGHVRLLTVALLIYGVGVAIPAFLQYTWVVALIPVIAAGAATVMTLPFSLLMRLLPTEHHGVASGLFGFSRGVGAMLGPMVAGAAILLLQPVFPETEGYSAMWLVVSASLLISLPFLLALRGDSRL